jgi:hypothetical protein
LECRRRSARGWRDRRRDCWRVYFWLTNP